MNVPLNKNLKNIQMNVYGFNILDFLNLHFAAFYPFPRIFARKSVRKVSYNIFFPGTFQIYNFIK